MASEPSERAMEIALAYCTIHEYGKKCGRCLSMAISLEEYAAEAVREERERRSPAMPNDEVHELVEQLGDALGALANFADSLRYTTNAHAAEILKRGNDALDRLAALARHGQEDRERLDFVDAEAGLRSAINKASDNYSFRDAIDAARKAEGGEGT